MPINKIAYRDGKDDFLDSNRYSPSFWLVYGSGIPQLDNALDSYAMGYELTDAFYKLVGERSGVMYDASGLADFTVTHTHSLWGNHK